MTYNDLQTIEMKSQKIRFQKEPAVLVPLSEWQKIEHWLEDFEMSQSKAYAGAILEARAEVRQGLVYAMDLRTGKFKKLKK